MIQRTGNIKINQRPQFWWEVVLRYCVAALFSSFLLLEQASGPAHTLQEECTIQEDSVLAAKGKSFAGLDQPIDLPAEPDPTSQEPETPDEGESTDNGDEAFGKLFCVSQTTNLNPHAEEELLSQLQAAIESRSKVSLFVLHHSWKSFLS